MKTYIDYKLIHEDTKPLGGVRGKKEYRKAARVEEVIGHTGRNHIFRGYCGFCDQEYIFLRREKSKSVYKCEVCNNTSTKNGGYFRRERTDFAAPKHDDFIDEAIYCAVMQYKDMKPNVHYYDAEGLWDAVDGDFYDPIAVWEVTCDDDCITTEEFHESEGLSDSRDYIEI